MTVWWAYVDESITRRGSTRTRMGMGGAIATFEKWQALSAEWEAILRSYGLKQFHMVDFENNAGEFKPGRGWCEERKKQLFNTILDVIDRHVRSFFGAGSYMKNPRKIPPSYGHNVTQTIGKATLQVQSWGGAVRLVFAKQPEFSFKRIVRWCELLTRAVPNLVGCSGDEPLGVPPLQVADIVAYEYTRTEGNPASRYFIRSMYHAEPDRIHNFFFTPFREER
jgi:hypothetical protein